MSTVKKEFSETVKTKNLYAPDTYIYKQDSY